MPTFSQQISLSYGNSFENYDQSNNKNESNPPITFIDISRDFIRKLQSNNKSLIENKHYDFYKVRIQINLPNLRQATNPIPPATKQYDTTLKHRNQNNTGIRTRTHTDSPLLSTRLSLFLSLTHRLARMRRYNRK